MPASKSPLLFPVTTVRYFALLILLAATTRVVIIAAPDDLPPVLREWIAGQPTLPDFKVDFTMTRKLPALKEPVTTTGSMWRLRDGRFRWQVGEPPMNILVFDGTTAHSWEEGSEWKELDGESRKARSWMDLLSGQAATLGELDRRFTVRVLESTPGSATVALDPRAAMTRKYLREIRLQLDPQSHHLKSLLIFQGNDTEIGIRFEEPVEMASIHPDVLKPMMLK